MQTFGWSLICLSLEYYLSPLCSEIKLKYQQLWGKQTRPRCCCGCHWTHETQLHLNCACLLRFCFTVSWCIKALVCCETVSMSLRKKQPQLKSFGNHNHVDLSSFCSPNKHCNENHNFGVAKAFLVESGKLKQEFYKIVSYASTLWFTLVNNISQ